MTQPTEQQIEAALDEIIHFAIKNAEGEPSNDHQSAWYEHAQNVLSCAPP